MAKENGKASIFMTYQRLMGMLNSDERWQLTGIAILTLLGMLLEIMSIGSILPALTMMTSRHVVEIYPRLSLFVERFGYSSRPKLVIIFMFLLVSAYILKTVFQAFLIWKQNKFIFGVRSSLSSRLFASYLSQEWSFHLRRNSAKLIQNITNEVNLLSGDTLQSGITLLTEGLIFFGVVMLLFIVKPVDTFILVSLLGLMVITYQQVTKRFLVVWGKERHYHEGLRIQHLQQGLGGAKDVKLLGREKEFLIQYHTHNIKAACASRKQKTLMDLPRLWLELLAVISLTSVVLLMLFGGSQPEMILPSLGFFATAAFRLLPSANRSVGAVQQLRFGWPVINILYAEIESLQTSRAVQNISLPRLQACIVLDRVSYQYVNVQKYALMDISLCIRQGTSIGLIGQSGSGKSTLVDVILGLLIPSKGSVHVDQVDIQTHVRSWQDQIGYVPQSIFLTDDTLRRNVTFGLSDDLIDEEAVQRAIKDAQLDDFVRDLPMGLDTLVGERGVRLSGGQRQRIGIARALYANPNILVLDEATSSLDIETEKSVMAAVNALHGYKTIIIVAHRLSTVAHCDWLYKLEDGRIVKEGRFEEITDLAGILPA